MIRVVRFRLTQPPGKARIPIPPEKPVPSGSRGDAAPGPGAGLSVGRTETHCNDMNMDTGRFFRALAPVLLLLAGSAFAGPDDKVLVFSTPGVDRYADGAPVLDGECYALVWAPAGRSVPCFGVSFLRFHPSGKAFVTPENRSLNQCVERSVALYAPKVVIESCRHLSAALAQRRLKTSFGRDEQLGINLYDLTESGNGRANLRHHAYCQRNRKYRFALHSSVRTFKMTLESECG